MMPRFTLSSHLHLCLLTQNAAAFTTILSTPHKHIAYHNAIPKTQLLTNSYIHPNTQANTPTVATLFSLPLTTSPNWSQWCWQHDETPQQAMKTNTPPNDSATYQRAHIHAGYFRNSAFVFNRSLFESNIIFLYDLCQYIILYIIYYRLTPG